MRSLVSTSLGFLGALLPVASASLQIVPGATWTASNGEHMQAHGGGILKQGNTYYLVGEDKTNGSAFQNVNCYSSTDLVQWHYVGPVLSRQGSGDLGPNRVIERPKLLWNAKTSKFVLWMHVDSSSYGEAKVGVATGDTVCGKYNYIGSFQPLGYQSRDMSVFQDDDGSAYLLTEDRQNGLRIDRLSDDYLNVTGPTYLWGDHIEAPAMVKVQGRYYMFGSHLTGWDPNDNVYSTSTSLTSGWTSWATFADKGSNTYASQTNYILPYGAGNVMYLGDRWQSSNLMTSTYVWLPLSISGTSVSMKNQVNWEPNVAANTTWTYNIPETSYEGEAGTAGGGAKTVSCSNCSGGKAMGYIGGSGAGTLTLSNVQGSAGGVLTTVRIKYVNGDSSPRYANVRVNGDGGTRVAFLPTGGNTGSSVLNVALQSGSGNTLLFEGISGGWGPDIDRVFVPTQ